MRSAAGLRKVRLLLDWASLSVAIIVGLGACAGGRHGGAREAGYPENAWAAGSEGDVTVETCPGSPSKIVTSATAELASSALQMSTRAGSPPAECKRTRFAFRRWPSPADVLQLTGDKDTVLVTRGLERASRLNCPSAVPFSEAAFTSGRSVAVLTIDAAGHVGALSLRQSVGGVNEARWVDQLRGCFFSPATLDGKPVASNFVSAVEWRSADP